MDLNTIQSATYILIQKFVQRQALVLEALRDLRPDLVIRLENSSKSELPAGYTRESWQALVLDYARRPATGDWGENKEWAYFLHGNGCRLTHKVTQERIEWDWGPLRRFDRFWFANYVKWLVDQDIEDKAIRTIREWYKQGADLGLEHEPTYGPTYDAVFPILEQLCQKGLISKREQYYLLINQDA